MKNWKTRFAMVTLSLAPVLGLSALSGCYVGVRPAYGPDVYVDGGYYYDRDYVDVYGVYHPRVYWYYHGGSWEHRDFAPHGYAMHERFHGGYRH
jgi:hypothetical protein